MSTYTDFHTLRYDTWPVCNGGNKRALPIHCTSKNEQHPTVRMHNLLLGQFKCPECDRESHYSMFDRRHR